MYYMVKYDREKFERAWNEQFSELRLLANSLPDEEALEFLEDVDELEEYLDIAVEHTYEDEN